MPASNSASITGYRDWQHLPVDIGSASVTVATKPGVFAHGRVDPSVVLLATHALIAPADIVMSLNCGNGLFGSVAATLRQAGHVLLADRNALSIDAATRTMAANRVENAELLLAHGVSSLPTSIAADVVAIRIPTERLALLQLLWDARSTLKPGGRCYLAGA